ncbi:MAG: UPF0104 family protein [Candidatus Syntrophonatronum acetioxidans]|uniref:Phosphatidylglycerol lysyltransferase n=1 Tax=Candidatus Syntrophonatronum acetioxidans TaxID=1795816 RepID=A0A424Y936_9FIRM|nr:MAG: UPF0104 family protein [Candidatus Syntrophonatronum acetioxidans]
MSSARAFLYITGIMVLAGMVLLLGWEDIRGVLLSTSPLALAGLCLLQVGTLSLIVYQWYYLLGKLYKGMPFSQVWSVFMAGNFIESVTPSVKLGGEAAKVYLFHRMTPLNYRQLTGMLFVHKYISLLPFLLLSSLLLFTVAVNLSFSPVFYLSLLFMAFVLVSLFILAVKGPQAGSRDGGKDSNNHIKSRAAFDLAGRLNLKGLFNKAEKGWRFLVGASSHSREMVTSGERRGLLLVSFLVWATYPVKVFGAAKMLGLEIDFLLIALATFASYLVSMVPLLPGGLGTYEGSMVFVLSLQGVDPAMGLALVLLSRFVTYWFPLVLSGISALYLVWLDRRKLMPEVDAG